MATRCPSCSGPMQMRKLPTKRGRPRKFCSEVCRRMHEHELRRVQVHLIRLEREAETCRRSDFPDMQFMQGGTAAERIVEVERELVRVNGRLRLLLAAVAA